LGSLEGLAASIQADGLLQNLVVAPAKGKNRYRIISGERRFRALKLLAERGVISADHEVPVEIRAGLSKDDTLRIATVENLQRQDLPPLDQAAALAALIRKGATLDDLVAKTGLSATTIKRRITLNSLCEEARTALSGGLVTLAQAEAITLGTTEAQRDMLERIAHSPDDYSASAIRDCLLDDKPTVAMAIFPLDRYTGTLTSDLFQAGETSYFDDVEQFMALQQEAVAQLAEQHRVKADWVEVTNDYHVRDWQFEEAQTGQPSGVLINLSPKGVVEIREGLLRSDELDEDTASETATSPLAPAPRKAAYPTPLRRLIAWHKTMAVQEVLLVNPRKAKELFAVAQLAALRPHAALAGLVKSSSPQAPYTAVDTQAALAARRLGLDPAGETGGGWQALAYDASSQLELYDAIKTLSDEDLDHLLLVLTVLSFGQVNCDGLDTGESLFNAVATDLQIDMRNHWRPDADFLNRRTRDQLIAIAQDCGYAESVGALGSWKKLELVNGLLRHFEQARQEAEPTQAQQKARAWLPEAMLFPAIDPGAASSDDASDGDADDLDEDDAA
jgi:ParB family chromosome partitioning protein